MLVVIALGSGLLWPGVPATADKQRAHVRNAAKALASIATEHQLVITHGNGPQLGLLALQSAACAKVEACPIDVFDAQTESMIAYMMEQELGNLLPVERRVARVATMVEVDADDPAFKEPANPIGPAYLRDEAERATAAKGWVFKPEGELWRRVVASPDPKHIFELHPIQWLLEHDTVVIAAGGGGIPMSAKGGRGRLVGIDCVIDRDLASGLLARELQANVLVMLSSVDAVYVDWGKPWQKAIRRASPDAITALPFPADSIGPKVSAACRFAKATGKRAVIGALTDLCRILAGDAGTTISTAEIGITYAAGSPAEGAIKSTARPRPVHREPYGAHRRPYVARPPSLT